jgi:hypothetical protein
MIHRTEKVRNHLELLSLLVTALSRDQIFCYSILYVFPYECLWPLFRDCSITGNLLQRRLRAPLGPRGSRPPAERGCAMWLYSKSFAGGALQPRAAGQSDGTDRVRRG